MGKTRIITADMAAKLIKSNMTIMIGGFMTNGTPKEVLKMVEASAVGQLTIICNDAGYEDSGTGRLIHNGQVKKLIASHIGLNKECGQLYLDGRLELVLQPQGTLAEQIRAAGAGLGGILTPVGVGTAVAKGKELLKVDGKEYLLEKPLRADVAVIQGYVADETGNIRYCGTMRNFNTVMATAADIVIAEVETILPPGEIGPEYVETAGIFVDYLVESGKGVSLCRS